MKQTAVDWLIGQLYAPCRGIPSHIIEQAKEMEKEQMVDAWSDGWLNDYEYDEDVKNSAEQYYNETFKTNEK
jgi:hypothetical protein